MSDRLYDTICTVLYNKSYHQVFALNEYILDKVDEDERVYLSRDTVAEPELRHEYQTEFLNSISMGGLPQHRLINGLKNQPSS